MANTFSIVALSGRGGGGSLTAVRLIVKNKGLVLVLMSDDCSAVHRESLVLGRHSLRSAPQDQ